MPSDILHWTPCRGTEAPSEIIALGIYLILKKRKAVVISFLLLFLTKYFFWLMQLLRFFISL